MKRKNLEKAVVLTLLLGCVTVPAWAKDNTDNGYLSLPEDGTWIGKMNGNGEGVKIDDTESYTSIDVNAIGVPDGNGYYNNSKTTTAFLISGSNADVSISGNVSIINSARHENIDNNNALYVSEGAKLNIDGDNVYIASYGGTRGRDAAISAKSNANVTIKGNVVQVIGGIDFINDETGSNVVNLELTSKNSFWYGNEGNPDDFMVWLASTQGYEISGGTLNLSLSNGAEWVYDGNGSRIINTPHGPLPLQQEVDRITSITLNGGVVNLQDDDIKQKYADYIVADDEEYIEHQKVTIENLSGTGGIFKADLDWAANNGQKNETAGSDYIYIEKMDESADGNSTQIIDFDASKAHLEQMKINEDKLYFANVKEGTTDFVTVNGTKQAVYSGSGNVFNYQYGVGNETETNSAATDWYIGLTGKSAEGNANVEAAKGAMYAGYALGTELDTLNKRMGEARYLEDDNGVWVRYRHAKTGWDDTFETNSDMFQLGFDNEVQEDDGKHYRGVAIDYTDADTSLNSISGDGEHERYAVSLYDTWLGEKGHYRDLVIRGGRINSDYDLKGMFTDGMHDIGGDYHQWFGSISAEWGRKNDMSKGWYFEPQTQLQLARVGGASYVTGSGIEVDQDGATSLIGRVGFRLGREYVKDSGKADNYYFKADLLHEFMGDKAIALTGADGRYENEYDGDETWFDIGLGADISIGKNSYFWADVERTIGADFDNTWQVNGGFRWEF